MERAKDNRLESLQNKGIELYSYSKLSSIETCLYGAYLTYHELMRGEGNIYSYAGTKIHDILEKIMNNQATESDLLPAVKNELDDLDMLGISFPKDKNDNDTLKDNWVKNMTHFCNTFKKPEGNFETESLFIYKTQRNNYIQGYIDLIKYNDDGSISIYDWKTSSMYSKEGIEEHSRQLLLYALGKIQEGYKVKEIAWIFLKYITVDFFGKKTVKSKEKTPIRKIIERRKIGVELSKYIENDLLEQGYGELETDAYITQVKEFNDLSVLPDDIKSNYNISLCVVPYELNDSKLKECDLWADTMINYWSSLGDNKSNYSHREFMTYSKTGKLIEDTFFCHSLCNHKSSCPYILDFDNQKICNEIEDSDDLFM